jgi:hypothetical protein
MLLAEGFWEIKNLSDTIGVVGLALTLLSIWLAWWLAKRDIEKRLIAAKKSARTAVERVATALS